MLFANPIWLWALMGLSIPVGIHLLSRKEGKVIRIGSLRHLQETNTQQFKGIRLNEIVLLALRCLLIVLFVLLMSGLRFESASRPDAKWVLIEKGLENLPEVQTQLDTFQSNGYEVRWLADGFPLYEDSASISIDPLYWKIAEQLHDKRFTDIIVLSKNKIASFKGKRPELPSNIRWIGIPAAASDFIVNAKVQGDSILVRKGNTHSGETNFITQVVTKRNWNGTYPLQVDSMEILIVSDKDHQYDKKIVEASLQTLRLLFPIKLNINNVSPEQIKSLGDWCIWLADRPVSDSITSNIIYLKPQFSNEILVREKANRWIFTKRLNEEVALNESLTVSLASLLLDSERDWKIVYENDRRMLSDESAWSNEVSGQKVEASLVVQPADSYLLILFLILLLIERMVAYYRNQ